MAHYRYYKVNTHIVRMFNTCGQGNFALYFLEVERIESPK
jgi:hypothetical protein